mmetsp:Transcript_17447/g.16658  ORF Transcript_17447/g.16658 Transcript_17447/m.16658 type:complete len:109 (+) Transcript_17447:17-343(+)|eukprot:CAMPEP_0170556840 /NCGR_PEP_ID=MMETSP0211-20121228/18998_1 /TAXON_ID=311385 /ORGANISM="Pseudokeronopsis sp., Strain OXSARD2" /LENGTH=108 /DNA_ID=CAMNT_0010867417 /DNA_START=7 /DNA_END=333 /DNA_ORIENTATION=+
MTSSIPNRPPDTPQLQFYSRGAYPKNVCFNQFKNPKAFPGEAASITDRNKAPNAELEVKPYCKSNANINVNVYNPKNHLRPFEFNDNQKNVSLNSLHATDIYNKRLAA